ncbi:MAG: hypothetical protein ACFE0O_06850 [Opitutales bacterium]
MNRWLLSGLCLLVALPLRAEIVLDGVGVTASRSPYPGSVAEVIDRYFTAVGGVDAWKAVDAIKSEVQSTTRLTGAVDRSTEATAQQVWAADGRFRTVTEVNGMTVLTLFDGEAMWKRSNNIKPVRIEINPFDLRRGNLLYAHQQLEAIFPHARIDRDGVDTVAVAFFKADTDAEPVEVWIFSKETGLRVGSRMLTLAPGMEPVPVEYRFEDYRAVGAVRMPHRIVYEVETSGVTSRTTLDLVSPVLNPDVPEGTFSPEF